MYLKLENYEIDNEKVEISSLVIRWHSNIGFGELTLIYNSKTKKWEADTECMGEDFAKSLIEFCNKNIKDNLVVVD